MTTGAPFIGSKISLISNAEIRYEGILYQVDTKESTVTLAKGVIIAVHSLFLLLVCGVSVAVRSFGTEDRPSAKLIPPRSEVYEFIIFRGSDIKDLNVSEMPEEPSSPPQDPAILSTVSTLWYSVHYLGCVITIAIHSSCAHKLSSANHSGQYLSAPSHGSPATPSCPLQHSPAILSSPTSHGGVFTLWDALLQTPCDDGDGTSPHAAWCDALTTTSSS